MQSRQSPDQNEQQQTGSDNALIPISPLSAFACVPVTGRLLSINKQGIPKVHYQTATGIVQTDARFSIVLDVSHIGSDVVLLLPPHHDKTNHQQTKNTKAEQPIIIGVIQSTLSAFINDNSQASEQADTETTVMLDRQKTQQLNAQIDGQSVTISAEHTIKLECGESSITLHKDGKIKIKGKYVISQAKKANRIRGGSVELN